MTRRELRQEVYQMLFRVEFLDSEEMEQQLTLLAERVIPTQQPEDDVIEIDKKTKKPVPENPNRIKPDLTQEEYQEIADRSRDVLSHLEEIDKAINEKSTGWKTGRMSKMDVAVLRLAVYELLFDDQVPEKVAINEAVELAKKFGTDESSAFVNGVLAKFTNKEANE